MAGEQLALGSHLPEGQLNDCHLGAKRLLPCLSRGKLQLYQTAQEGPLTVAARCETKPRGHTVAQAWVEWEFLIQSKCF